MAHERSFKVKDRRCMAVLILITASLISACSHQREPGLRGAINEQGKASIHEVSNDKIRRIMHKLDTIIFERFYSELERDHYRLRYAGQIVEIVNELNRELEHDPSLKLELNDEQRQDFLGLAQQLKQQTNELNQLVSKHQSSEINTKLKQITKVCSSCHQKFRSR